VSNSNIIVKNSLVDQSVSDELIELRNEGHQRRMGGLKQNFEPNNLFFQNHEPGHIINLKRTGPWKNKGLQKRKKKTKLVNEKVIVTSRNIIKASTRASTSNIIAEIVLSTKALAELIESMNGGHQRRMGGLKQNFEPNNLFFSKP
jgi:hypothetical protein